MSELQPMLSVEGRHRRRQILRLAMAEARGRRRRRVLVRVTAAGLLIAALVPALFRIQTSRETPIAIRLPRPAPQAPIRPQILVTRIETDPHIIERLEIPPLPVHVTLINDRELLDDLAQARHPAALAYVNGKAMLLYR